MGDYATHLRMQRWIVEFALLALTFHGGYGFCWIVLDVYVTAFLHLAVCTGLLV